MGIVPAPPPPPLDQEYFQTGYARRAWLRAARDPFEQLLKDRREREHRHTFSAWLAAELASARAMWHALYSREARWRWM